MNIDQKIEAIIQKKVEKYMRETLSSAKQCGWPIPEKVIQDWIADANRCGTQAGIKLERERVKNHGLTDRIVRSVCEMPGKNSPDDQPDNLDITVGELIQIIDIEVESLIESEGGGDELSK